MHIFYSFRHSASSAESQTNRRFLVNQANKFERRVKPAMTREDKSIHYYQFLKYISQAKADEFINLLDERAKLVEISTEINICRDPKDNFLLSLAVDSSADFLISGDLDLLSIKQIETTKIINFKDFENIF